MSWSTRLMLSLGAGLYEELLFRVLLVSARRLGRVVFGFGVKGAGVFATIVGALIFSAFHYIGPFGDPFSLTSFTFRAISGVAFSALYLLQLPSQPVNFHMQTPVLPPSLVNSNLSQTVNSSSVQMAQGQKALCTAPRGCSAWHRSLNELHSNLFDYGVTIPRSTAIIPIIIIAISNKLAVASSQPKGNIYRLHMGTAGHTKVPETLTGAGDRATRQPASLQHSHAPAPMMATKSTHNSNKNDHKVAQQQSPTAAQQPIMTDACKYHTIPQSQQSHSPKHTA